MADLNEAMLGTVGNTDDGREFHKRRVLVTADGRIPCSQLKGWL